MINQQNDCEHSEDSDQPGNSPSQTRVFAVRMKKAWVLSYLLGANSFCWFCHVAAQTWTHSQTATTAIEQPPHDHNAKQNKLNFDKKYMKLQNRNSASLTIFSRTFLEVLFVVTDGVMTFQAYSQVLCDVWLYVFDDIIQLMHSFEVNIRICKNSKVMFSSTLIVLSHNVSFDSQSTHCWRNSACVTKCIFCV